MAELTMRILDTEEFKEVMTQVNAKIDRYREALEEIAGGTMRPAHLVAERALAEVAASQGQEVSQ